LGGGPGRPLNRTRQNSCPAGGWCAAVAAVTAVTAGVATGAISRNMSATQNSKSGAGRK
jgi:hypothetical protein